MPYRTVEVQMKEIPYGNPGIMVSASELVKIIKQFRKDPQIRFTAENIVKDCPNKDYTCEGKKIFEWVKKNVRFTRDPYRVEMLRSPLLTLEHKQGDCDDHTILTSSLLQSIGHPTRIVLVATRKLMPKNFNHVFSEVEINGKWIPLDTTVKESYFGWLPTGYTYKKFEVEE
jgi:transglutaminase-like putative cysteine protease